MELRFRRGARHLFWALVGVTSHPRLLLEMWRLERSLPAQMAKTPLPEFMNTLSSGLSPLRMDPAVVCQFADTVTALDIRSPLGICLRRSLLRYYFLRRAGLPVAIHFGARFKDKREIGGHAWLTLNGEPYAEHSENYLGFAVMYTYPLVEN